MMHKFKNPKFLNIFLLICLLAIKSNSALAQDSFIKMMNDTIHSIKYVFEARIDSVQSYAGYKNGDPIPFSKADKGGNFDDEDGNSAICYSKVWVSVCRVYKGKLPRKFILLIPNPFVRIYAVPQPNGDTTLGYLQSYPSHGHYDSPLLPSKSYPITQLYWCFDVTPLKGSKFYTLNKCFESPMLLKGTIPKSDGSFYFGITYAMLGTKTFMNQEELSNYLKQIKTLNARPTSSCK